MKLGWKTYQKVYIQDISKGARKKYVQRVLSFLNHSNLKPLKIVANSGNGTAGPTFDAIADELSRIDPPQNLPEALPCRRCRTARAGQL